MLGPRLLILLAFALVVGIPLAFRPPSAVPPEGAAKLIVITPHNEQIRAEFGHAFDQWHRRVHGQPAVIDWRTPGGTSEIRKQLQAIYKKAISIGQIRADGSLAHDFPSMPFDICLGGGSYEHEQLKVGVSDAGPGETTPFTLSISEPAGMTSEQLEAWFGENVIGAGKLFDPEQYWIGTALSGFGIVYNRDVLRKLGLDEPVNWSDLADPRYARWLALADPRQSGSVETTYNSILDHYGWDEGWRVLRAMCANARYFANTAPKIPLDVSQGEAAAGVAIDFYGRYQSQAVMQPGETPETSRVGYIDPPGAVFIDPDPVSILRAGPNPELARRFVEFLLTEEAQALWQFPARGEEPGLGPTTYELRRMPITREMYEHHMDRFVDRVNAFEIASTTPSRGWRSALRPMMGSFAIDIHHDQTRAWAAMNRARAAGAPAETLAEMERLFFAWPTHTLRTKAQDGTYRDESVEFNEANYRAIRSDWREAEKDGRMNDIRIGYTAFFRANYRAIIRMADSSGHGDAHAPRGP